MSLYIPGMTDEFGNFVQGLVSNFQALDGSQIVEWGSNENGTYWRWENGLQICISPLFKVPCDATIAGTNWHYTGDPALWTYPALFWSLHIVQATNRGLGAVGASIRNVTNSRARLGLFTGEERDGTGSNDVVQGLVIGRWK